MHPESHQPPPLQASPEVPSPPPTALTATRDGLTPWPPELAARYRRDGLWRDQTLTQHIDHAARQHPDSTALIDNTTRLTYRELLTRSQAFGHGLRDLALTPGDRVIVQLPNMWQHVIATLGALHAGLVPVWALPEHRLTEIAGLLDATGARTLITTNTHRDVDLEQQAWAAADTHPTLRNVIIVGDPHHNRSHRFDHLTTTNADCAAACDTPRAADDLAILIPSGGTTGMAKVAPRTHNDIAYMAWRAGEICGFDTTTVYLAALPLGHGFPNTGPGVLGTLMRGGRVVITPTPSPEHAFSTMTREQVTATSIVPAIAHRWLDHATRTGHTPPTLALLQVGAAHLPPDTARAIETTLGCRLQQVYGMSEGLLCLTRRDDGDLTYTTQGQPISEHDEIRVVDDQDTPLPAGATGALHTRGPYTIRGYFAAAGLNRTAFTPDGWYRTGDLAHLTPTGHVIITGREKDVINRGGEKVSADEIETHCHDLGITDCAAVAMPHPILGEDICLYLTPTDRTRFPLTVLTETLLTRGLAPYKIPKHIATIDVIPRTPLGKINKKLLRAHLTATPDSAQLRTNPDLLVPLRNLS